MKKWIYSLILILGVLSACSINTERELRAIHAVLEAQAEGWNQGDLNAYMQGYWKNEDLRFSSGEKITYGFDNALRRYKQRYPDQRSMGVLSFTELSTSFMGEQAAFTTGAWRLEREKGDLHGRFTLIWKKFDDEWLIVADHSS